MISPVTSTKVATKGADEVAGSNPSHLSTKGSIEPESVPHNTIPTSEIDTVRGYAKGAVDYVSVPVIPEILRAYGLITSRIDVETTARPAARYAGVLVGLRNRVASLRAYSRSATSQPPM